VVISGVTTSNRAPTGKALSIVKEVSLSIVNVNRSSIILHEKNSNPKIAIVMYFLVLIFIGLSRIVLFFVTTPYGLQN
jgi:hypothetical protein